MSLIIGYANKENAIIMSDGRAGKNGSLSESYNKTMKINDNIILGFAGFIEPIDLFLNHAISQMGADRNLYYIEDFWELVQFLINDSETQLRLRSSFIILGRDKKNNMYSSIFGDNTNYKLKVNMVTTPRYTSIGGTIDGNIINKIYTDYITNYIMPVRECMQKTILQVSTLDPSVNANIFEICI